MLPIHMKVYIGLNTELMLPIQSEVAILLKKRTISKTTSSD